MPLIILLKVKKNNRCSSFLKVLRIFVYLNITLSLWLIGSQVTTIHVLRHSRSHLKRSLLRKFWFLPFPNQILTEKWNKKYETFTISCVPNLSLRFPRRPLESHKDLFFCLMERDVMEITRFICYVTIDELHNYQMKRGAT